MKGNFIAFNLSYLLKGMTSNFWQRIQLIEMPYKLYTSRFFLAAILSSIMIIFARVSFFILPSLISNGNFYSWVLRQTVIVHLGALYCLHVNPFRVVDPTTIVSNIISCPSDITFTFRIAVKADFVRMVNPVLFVRFPLIFFELRGCLHSLEFVINIGKHILGTCDGFFFSCGERVDAAQKVFGVVHKVIGFELG